VKRAKGKGRSGRREGCRREAAAAAEMTGKRLSPATTRPREDDDDDGDWWGRCARRVWETLLAFLLLHASPFPFSCPLKLFSFSCWN
jgi:hypothetical protein